MKTSLNCVDLDFHKDTIRVCDDASRKEAVGSGCAHSL